MRSYEILAISYLRSYVTFAVVYTRRKQEWVGRLRIGGISFQTAKFTLSPFRAFPELILASWTTFLSERVSSFGETNFYRSLSDDGISGWSLERIDAEQKLKARVLERGGERERWDDQWLLDREETSLDLVTFASFSFSPFSSELIHVSINFWWKEVIFLK